MIKKWVGSYESFLADMCSDYRKLNLVTQNDRFSLHFIEQILECVAGMHFIYFWMVIQVIIKLNLPFTIIEAKNLTYKSNHVSKHIRCESITTRA